MERIGLYIMLKARYLGKRIRIIMEEGVTKLDKNQLQFIKEHGIFPGIRDVDKIRKKQF